MKDARNVLCKLKGPILKMKLLCSNTGRPVLLSLFSVVIAAGNLAAATAERPNILYFYVDDMGWGSIGPNGQAARRAGGQPTVRTPNLDRLAEQGINFTRGYGCHVCSPARSSQQTGFHQGHTFADRNDRNNAKKAMRADDICMGDVLAKAGYVTGYWGKWGYGGSMAKQDPTLDNLQTLPTSHGYQHVVAELHHVRAHTFFQPTLWTAPAPRGTKGGLYLAPNSMAGYRNNEAYPGTPALQNHPDYPKTAYCDDVYAFAALDFVRRNGQNYKKTGQPFFGLLAVQIPHAPFGEIAKLPEWDKAYADDPKFKSLATQTKQWAAMVTRIDAHFGNILSALEDPNNDGDSSDSVASNTLIVFQSDNGGPGGKNNVELDANGGLKGTKGSIWEGGIRVPLVMRWPAKITGTSKLKVGTNTDRVVDVSDLLPTFCELAEAPVPLGIDGVSIAPALQGSRHQRPRDFIIHEAGGGKSIIRGKYKLVLGGKSAGKKKSTSKRKGQGKKTAAPGGPTLNLFDLEADHGEKKNIAAEHPELVEELHALLLGERVTEPHGFANTYHRWTGKDGDSTSGAGNWSDYVYANAGITYTTDDGAPQLSWVARIKNTETASSTARADKDLNVLALEVGVDHKNPHAKATQALSIGAGVTVNGRNEVRVSRGGMLTLDGGTVKSLRWVDVHAGATLKGNGTVDATLYNNGSVAVTGSKRPSLEITRDYYQAAEGTLTVLLDDRGKTAFEVTGSAELDGTLAITVGDELTPSPGDSYTMLKAKRIEGRFSNSDSEVVATNGSRFKIRYSASAVTLTAK
jgi:arylsulfatase A-like enzyme